MKKHIEKVIFISWARHVPRSRNLSKSLNAKDFYIEYLKETPIFFVPFRYLLQSIKTFFILFRQKPELVIAMNPPFVCPLIVYLYSRITGIGFIIDSGHTGAFVGVWKRFFFIQKFLSRNAIFTIVTNIDLERIVRSWNARAFVLPDKLPEFPNTPINEEKNSTGNKIGVIFTFGYNDPVVEVLNAAKSLPNFEFGITGDLKRARSSYFKIKPGNVQFTGYLTGSDYWRFLQESDAIMVLTTTNYELSCAAYEAVSVGKPLIISNWPTIRDYFRKGAVYVDNSVEGIARGVKEFFREKDRLYREVKELRIELNADMGERIHQFRNYIKDEMKSGKNPSI